MSMRNIKQNFFENRTLQQIPKFYYSLLRMRSIFLTNSVIYNKKFKEILVAIRVEFVRVLLGPHSAEALYCPDRAGPNNIGSLNHSCDIFWKM